MPPPLGRVPFPAVRVFRGLSSYVLLAVFSNNARPNDANKRIDDLFTLSTRQFEANNNRMDDLLYCARDEMRQLRFKEEVIVHFPLVIFLMSWKSDRVYDLGQSPMTSLRRGMEKGPGFIEERPCTGPLSMTNDQSQIT
jgi:hypothetical protein